MGAAVWGVVVVVFCWEGVVRVREGVVRRRVRSERVRGWKGRCMAAFSFVWRREGWGHWRKVGSVEYRCCSIGVREILMRNRICAFSFRRLFHFRMGNCVR